MEAQLKTQCRRALWIERINKPTLRDENITDAQANFFMEDDPDWAPSLFMGDEDDALNQHEEEEVAAKRARNEVNEDVAGGADHPTSLNVSCDPAEDNVIGAERYDTHVDDNYAGNDLEVSVVGSVADESFSSFSGLNVSCSTVNTEVMQDKAGHDKLMKKLVEIKSAYRNLRNRLTELECDKLDLEKSGSGVNNTLQNCEDEKKQLEEECATLKLELKESKENATNLEEQMRDRECEKARLSYELEKLRPCTLSFEEFRNNEDKVKFYTGLPSFAMFDNVVKHVSAHVVCNSKASLETWQGILLTMMRLRLNLTLQDLAYRFNIHTSIACKTFEKWLYAIYVCLDSAVVWPDRETLYKTMPNSFKEALGKSVAVIIACFEIFVNKPTSLDTRAQTWSNYKHHNTIKYLIGIIPCGAISFISEAWGGRARDKDIAVICGLFDKLLPQDVVMEAFDACLYQRTVSTQFP